jgi:hypothetical protein
MSLYQRMRQHWKKPEFWIMILIAVVIVSLSFNQTAELAKMVGATEKHQKFGFAVLVEILFAFSLLVRSNQRASGKHVPWLLHAGYFGMLGVVTIINMSVLYQKHPVAGPFVGALISAAMLYVESLFVWINVDADRPARKTPKQLMREAKREIEEEKIIQKIEYLKWKAKKPDLSLIKMARRDEEKRRRIETGKSWLSWPWKESIEEKELPEYFRRKPEPTPEIEAEPVEPVIVQEPEPEPESEQEKHIAEVVPIKRPIGFHVEMSNTETPDATTIEQRSNTPKLNAKSNTKSNTKKRKSSNTKTTKKEQAIQYVIGLIERDEDYSVTSVANEVGCARSTASVAIREAESLMQKEK